MKPFLIALFMLCFLTLHFTGANAGELSTAIDVAIKKNYKVRVSEYEVIASEYDTKKTLSPFFPTLNASANTKWNDSDTLTKADNTTAKNSYNSNGYSLSLSQTIFDFSNIVAYQIGTLDHDINQLKHYKVINDIIINVVENYFSYLKYHSQYIATESELISSQARFKHVKRNHELGNVAKTDVYEAYAKKETNIQSLADIQKNLDVALLNLQSTTQIKMIPSVDVQIDQYYQEIDKQQQAELEQYMLVHNYDLIIAKENTKKAIKTAQKSRTGFYPTVSSSINYQFTDSNNDGTDSANTTYSLDLAIPISNGGSDYYTYQKNVRQIEKSNIEYEQTLDDTHVSFKELIYDINHNVYSIHALKSTIVSNYAVYRGSQRAYTIGTKTLTDLLGAESTLYNSIRDFQANQYDYIINVSKLKAMLGPVNLSEIEAISNVMIPVQKTFDLTILDKFKGELDNWKD